jgi:hypothetical protein
MRSEFRLPFAGMGILKNEINRADRLNTTNNWNNTGAYIPYDYFGQWFPNDQLKGYDFSLDFVLETSLTFFQAVVAAPSGIWKGGVLQEW